jgi:hypothetical protein
VVIIIRTPCTSKKVYMRELQSSFGKQHAWFLGQSALFIHRELHFMKDGAPAHFSLVARRYQNQMFSGRWTGRGGPIAWPPHSPVKIHSISMRRAIQNMTWKLSEIEMRQVSRQNATCQEFGIVFRWQWDVNLRPVFRQEVDICDIYCRIFWRAECHGLPLKTWKLCISGPMLT